MNPYIVDVSELAEELGSSVDADAPFGLDGYRVGDDEYHLTEPATVNAVVTNTGAGLVASGTVTAHVNASCARCLCTFPLTVTGEVEGFYVHPGDDVDLPEEQEVEFIAEGETIDLAPALHAALVLETPFAPLHDPECAGICTQCGVDLNEGTCSCEPSEDEASPFAKLAELELGPDDTEQPG